MSNSCIKIQPFQYIHVFDKNTNVSRLEQGPQTFIRQDHENVSTKTPQKMIVLPPRHYCKISNPVIRDANNQLVANKYGQITVKIGEDEYRFHENYQEPFPLYPDEVLSLSPQQLPIIKELEAFKIEANRDFSDKKAGDVWLIYGPSTYYPKVEENQISKHRAQQILTLQALRLRANQDLVDGQGNSRKTGEEYLIRDVGPYMPTVHEEVLELQEPYIITDRNSIKLRAIQAYKDVYGVDRKAGDEWILTTKQTTSHCLDIYEEYIEPVQVQVLNDQEYCIILNPYDEKTGKNRNGAEKLVIGRASFFLQPGEELSDVENGIKKAIVLGDNDALLLKANKSITVDTQQVDQQTGKVLQKTQKFEPGDKWLQNGPCRYVPPVEVEIVETRSKIALDKNEGIYVRDTRSGVIRSVMNESYLLQD